MNVSNSSLKKIFTFSILIAVFFLFSFFAAGMDCMPYEDDPTRQQCWEEKWQPYNTSVPIINVTFQESVEIINFTLYKIGELGSPFPEDYFQEPQENYERINITNISSSSYRPANHISDGIYLFRIKAFNVPNINIDTVVLFSINSSSMKFWVTKPVNLHVTPEERPNFGISSNRTFFLEIRGERPIEECRYSIYPLDPDQTLEYEYEWTTTNSFTTNSTDARFAYVQNFAISDYFYGYNYNGELKNLYVICKDVLNKYSFKTVVVAVDESPPQITLGSVPNPVIAMPDRKTTFTVNTTDRSACMINISNRPAAANGKPVINRTQNYDFTTIDEFVKAYNEVLAFHHQPDPYNYTFTVTCDNLANLRATETYDVRVALQQQQTFEFYAPPAGVNSSTILINGSTVVYNDVTCAATLTPGTPSSFVKMIKIGQYTPEGRGLFLLNLTNVADGEHTIYVNCTYMGEGVFSTTEVTVDRTPPLPPNITMDNFSCSTSTISATLKSTDLVSGVKKYYYNFTLNNDPAGDYAIVGESDEEDISVDINGEEIYGRNYTLKAYAEDNAGNVGLPSTKIIQVLSPTAPQCDLIPPADFWVSKPENLHVDPDEHPDFAVGNASTFFLELKADRELSECRYAIFDFGYTPSPFNQSILANAFDEHTNNLFTTNTTNSRYAYVQSFSLRNHFGQAYDNNGDLRIIYTICKDNLSKYTYKELIVAVDETPSSISVNAVPNPIISMPNRVTNFSIQTGDRTACMIKIESPPPAANGKPIIIRTPEYDFTNIEEFVKLYSEQLLFSHVPNPYNYTFNITCDNLANLRTSAIYVVRTDLKELQTFEFYEPPAQINTMNLFINGSIVVHDGVTCRATLNKSNPAGFVSLTKQGYYVAGRMVYTGTIPYVPDGQQTVYVNCTHMNPGEFSTTNVVVDKTPPGAPNISMYPLSCSATKIEANLQAADERTGIKKYYYNFTLDNDLTGNYTKSGTSVNGKITISINGNQIMGRTYTLKAYAEDGAGNLGAYAIDTIIVSNASTPLCDKTPPTINIAAAKNQTTNMWTVKVDCQDKESGCTSEFRYTVETNLTKDCVPLISSAYTMPILISQPATFCAVVFDNNNNNDSDEKEVTLNYPAKCFNGVKDTGETDIDCGGQCAPCLLNKTCIIPADCSSNYCYLNKCTMPSCTDFIKNGYEVGVDCGGMCSACGLGTNCTLDSDCGSLNCQTGICTAASCTNNKKDGIETAVDCGGNCQKCMAGSVCTSDEDCITDYCETTYGVYGICTAAPPVEPLTCSNGIKDGSETGLDCGGLCTPCATQNTCSNGRKDESETGVDCGGLCTPCREPPKGGLLGGEYNIISLILLALGLLMIIAGVIIKVMSAKEMQKKQKEQDEMEMKRTLNQVPKLSTLKSDTQGAASNAQDEALRQKAKEKAAKLKELERKKLMDQFDSPDKSGNSSSPKPEEKIGAAFFAAASKEEKEKKERKFLDEGLTEEYVEVEKLKKGDDDSFSKIKELADEKRTGVKRQSDASSIPDKKETKSEVKTQEKPKSSPKKQPKEDEVFEKLKKMTKQAKAKK